MRTLLLTLFLLINTKAYSVNTLDDLNTQENWAQLGREGDINVLFDENGSPLNYAVTNSMVDEARNFLEQFDQGANVQIPDSMFLLIESTDIFNLFVEFRNQGVISFDVNAVEFIDEANDSWTLVDILIANGRSSDDSLVQSLIAEGCIPRAEDDSDDGFSSDDDSDDGFSSDDDSDDGFSSDDDSDDEFFRMFPG